ncbi:gp38 [Burkholderia pseudomallei]|nr:gp38 [Burkholderia pseudomallei]
MGEKLDAAKQPAPSPVDERAAFDSEVGNIIADAATRGIAWMAFKVGARYARAASANETGADGAKTEAEIRKTMTPEQIRLERNLTCEAIDGAMSFGYQNTNPPPSADHWLAPFWKIGRKQYAAEFALRYLDDQLTEYLEGMPADETSRNLRNIARNALVDIEAAPRSPAMAAEAVAFEITEQAAAEWASRHDVDHVLKHFSTQRNAIEDARTLHLLAASPSSQPAAAAAAAAPIENAEEMRDAAMRTVQAMGFVYAPGSERWHPNVNHIPAPSLAEERRASWYCCDPVQICSAQCDSCAKQARAALKAIIDERAECIAWANANGFTKYHESMCAAWEERARRAAQQLSAEIRELKVKLGSYEREREDQTRYLAAQSEEIAALKYQLAQADARVGLTATVIQKCIDSCAAEYLEDVTGHPEDAAYCQGITDCIDALNRLKTADWSVILAAHSGQSEPLDMLLFCPKCGVQHIDHAEPAVEHEHGAVEFGAWDNPPHRSHLCHACGTIWRPADVPTNGVAAIATRGKADTWDGKPEPRAEVTDEPSLTNPLTPYGMLVRALRIVSGTTLMDMADALLTTPAKLSAMEFDREPVTPEFAFDVAAYFDAIGVLHTASALRAAAARTGGQ